MDGKSAGERTWRTSTLCESRAYVEVSALGEFVLVRNAADPDDRYITLSRDEWQVFVAGVKVGDLDAI
jgi:hypothetical protein